VLLTLSRVAKTFGPDTILTAVDFRIDAREKVALVGRNGTGKTTLLKIVTGAYEPDGGAVQLARGAKVGYLRQEAPVAMGRTVLEEAQSALESQLAMKARLEELERRLEGEPSAEDLEEYALLHEHFLEAEGYSLERDVRTVLQRMGFEESEFEKQTSSLSGGERTRLAIARLLLEEPDLLILDEPTNHLDLQATEWLESWIRAYHGAVLLVSHDRTFLQATAERVLELRDGKVVSYPGPFEKFLELRRADEERQAEVARRQAHEIAKLDEFVRRFINSQRTAQARGRQKIMERMVEARVDAPKADRGIKGGFGKVARSGDVVLACDGVEVGFPDETLFAGFDWSVRWGERWGVIGENGAGKSTLMKVVLGHLEPRSGRVRLGSNVTVGYFSQDAADLDVDRSPFDLLVWDDNLLPADARNLLGRFLITGDDAFRPIRTLSGGEKNKLSLARLTHLKPNLLILDEPTNHLDIDSREALAEILREYEGTLVLVSHDRWLLSQVTEQTLDVRRSGPVQFGGSYSEYRQRQLRTSPPQRPVVSAPAAGSEPERPATLSPRELSKEIQRTEKVVAETEAQVAQAERRLREVESTLANLPPDADVLALTREHQTLQDRIEGELASWEEHSLRLEELRALQGR
jgi:ATP-binding cassette, subfamily F, member 3